MDTKDTPEFVCGECGEKFSSLFSCVEHGNVHSGERPFACPECLQTFQLIAEYCDHFKEKHKHQSKTSEEELVHHGRRELCTVDMTVFRETPFTSNHTQEEVPLYKNLSHGHHYTCELCSKKFQTKRKLSRHKCFSRMDEKDPKKTPILCSCLTSFPTVEDFRKHLGSYPYSCCACEMKFLHLINLKLHIRSHTNEKPFACKLCNRAFAQNANLKNHMSIHSNEKVKCHLCSFSCRTPGGMFKHLKKHELGLPVVDQRKVSSQVYPCATCGKTFKFVRNLGMHMKSHCDYAILCPTCGKIFDSTKKLTFHIKNAHGETYACSFCQKEFKGIAAIRSHIRTHNTDKRYECDVCKKCFALPEYLKSHMQTHDKIISHDCTSCGKQFKSYQSHKYHKKVGCGGAKIRRKVQIQLSTSDGNDLFPS